MSEKEPCTIYLLRHGETEWNKRGLLQGHTDIALSEEGIRQAQERSKHFKDVPFTAVFSSDLARAKQTAAILTQGRNVPFETSESLRERSWGDWEGQRFQDLKARHGATFDVFNQDPHPLNNVETLYQAAHRVSPILGELGERFPGQHILVVSHGGVLKSLLYYLDLKDISHGSFTNLGYLKLKAHQKSLQFVEADGLIH